MKSTSPLSLPYSHFPPIFFCFIFVTFFLSSKIELTIYTPTICICKGWKVKCRGILLYREDSRLFWCCFCTEQSKCLLQSAFNANSNGWVGQIGHVSAWPPYWSAVNFFLFWIESLGDIKQGYLFYVIPC